MRYRLILLVGLAASLAIGQPRTPVIVELFTSEGCSSCPPADRMLAQMETQSPVSGAEVIALGEHVDYWDNLGWRDRFSMPALTDRQQFYGRAFTLESVYTPQMVVNGAAQFSGTDFARAQQEIRKAIEAPRASVAITLTPAGTVALGVASLPGGVRNADVLLAITETNLETLVRGGENRDRRLRHTGVVRSLNLINRLDTHKHPNYAAEAKLNLQPDWKRENLRAVVFVQDRATHRIVGAAYLTL